MTTHESSILAHTSEIVVRHLGIGDDGPGQPQFRSKTVALSLSETPPAEFNCRSMLDEILLQIETNFLARKAARPPSAQNWRFEKKLEISADNKSPEKTLEKTIARIAGPDWVNQVPTSSGLSTSSNDKHRNIDLVYRRDPLRYEFIELKVGSDTPLYAAIEILLNGALYLFARTHLSGGAPPLNAPLLAQHLHLRVLAPAPYYERFQLGWLQTSISGTLQEKVSADSRLPETMDFAFCKFPESFEWPCSDDTLLEYLKARSQVSWHN
jgi:hypothetical protein